MKKDTLKYIIKGLCVVIESAIFAWQIYSLLFVLLKATRPLGLVFGFILICIIEIIWLIINHVVLWRVFKHKELIIIEACHIISLVAVAFFAHFSSDRKDFESNEQLCS